MDPLYRFARAEAIVAGVGTLLSEVYISYVLYKRGRLLYYYHVFPIATSILIIASGIDTFNVPLSLASTFLTACTCLNFYNTYYVHVVLMEKYVKPLPPLLRVRDVFLPKYISEFYPWGPFLMLIYSLAVAFHCTFRAWFTGILIVDLQ